MSKYWIFVYWVLLGKSINVTFCFRFQSDTHDETTVCQRKKINPTDACRYVQKVFDEASDKCKQYQKAELCVVKKVKPKMIFPVLPWFSVFSPMVFFEMKSFKLWEDRKKAWSTLWKASLSQVWRSYPKINFVLSNQVFPFFQSIQVRIKFFCTKKREFLYNFARSYQLF